MKFFRTPYFGSPLFDNVFGLSLQKVQEEVNKSPQPLTVNVQLTNCKRSVSVSTSAPTGPDKRVKVFVPKASGPKKHPPERRL